MLAQLDSNTEGLTDQQMKISKYCCEMWLALAAQRSLSYLQGLLKVALHLIETGSKATSGPLRLSILVLLLIHIRAIGTYYSSSLLIDFACQTARTFLPSELFTNIFEGENWTKVLNFAIRPFCRSQSGQFRACGDFGPFPTFSLSSLFTSAFPRVSLEGDEENDWRDSSEPLGTLYSESSVSSQPMRPLDPSDPPSKPLSSVAFYEDEQRDLLYRLTEDS